MMVNFQVADGIPDGAIPPIVYYDTVSHVGEPLFPIPPYRFRETGRSFLYQSIDVNRGIFWVQLENLEPDTGIL